MLSPFDKSYYFLCDNIDFMFISIMYCIAFYCPFGSYCILSAAAKYYL